MESFFFLSHKSGLGYATCFGQRSIKKRDASRSLKNKHWACPLLLVGPLLSLREGAQISLVEDEKTWGAKAGDPEEAPMPSVLPTTRHMSEAPCLCLGCFYEIPETG